MENKFYDVIIVGGGCAGLTAAIYARRAGKTVLVLEKETFGGQIAFSPKVENFPGFESIGGSEFADHLFSQADSLGANLELEKVLEIKDGRIKTVVTEYDTYTCAAVIIAAGLKHRMTGAEGEGNFIGRGISFCAVCDGDFYKGKDVLVVGGGNTALEDALFLSDICRSVRLIHRRDTFRGEVKLLERIRGKSNITVITDTVMKKASGDDVLKSVTLENVKTGEVQEIGLDGVFLAVGRIPESGLFEGLVETDGEGYIVSSENCLTGKAGIFTAGDCRTKSVRQLTTAAADGSVAALAACRYIDSLR